MIFQGKMKQITNRGECFAPWSLAMLKGEGKRKDEFINSLMGRRRSGLSVHAEDHIARDNRVSYQALGTICGACIGLQFFGHIPLLFRRPLAAEESAAF